MSRLQICRLIGIVSVFVWAAVLLFYYMSGKIDSTPVPFIKPEHLKVCCLLGGLGLAVMGVFNLINIKTDIGCCGHDHDHGDDEHDHDHDHEDDTYTGNIAMALVLIFPLLISAKYANGKADSLQALENRGFMEDSRAVASQVQEQLNLDDRPEGANQNAEPGNGAQDDAEDDWEYTIEDLEKVVDRDDTGYLELTVDQIFYTSGDRELQGVLDGEKVTAVGQVIPENGFNPDGKRLRVFTLMVTCCRADAQPVSVPLQFAETPPQLGADAHSDAEFREMDWVKISGRMTYPQEAGRANAVILIDEMIRTEEPMGEIMF